MKKGIAFTCLAIVGLKLFGTLTLTWAELLTPIIIMLKLGLTFCFIGILFLMIIYIGSFLIVSVAMAHDTIFRKTNKKWLTSDIKVKLTIENDKGE